MNTAKTTCPDLAGVNTFPRTTIRKPDGASFLHAIQLHEPKQLDRGRVLVPPPPEFSGVDNAAYNRHGLRGIDIRVRAYLIVLSQFTHTAVGLQFRRAVGVSFVHAISPFVFNELMQLD